MKKEIEELQKIHEEIEEEHKLMKPMKIIMGIFLVLMLVSMVVPYYYIKLDPEPRNIPGLEVVPASIKVLDPAKRIATSTEMYAMVDGRDTVIKQIADKVAVSSCKWGNKICHAKAIFYFVQNRDNFQYVSDPIGREYVKTARETLNTKAYDCEDASILLASMLDAVGVQTQFVFIPGHVYVQMRIPDYRKGNWLDLDATCSGCEFGKRG